MDEIELFNSMWTANANGCHIWHGPKGVKGYGAFSYDGFTQRANRASWELHVGPIPVGFYVLHRCDNPSCVNPAHLFLGTAEDNTDDMIIKGRAWFQRKGVPWSHPKVRGPKRVPIILSAIVRERLRHAAAEAGIDRSMFLDLFLLKYLPPSPYEEPKDDAS